MKDYEVCHSSRYVSRSRTIKVVVLVNAQKNSLNSSSEDVYQCMPVCVLLMFAGMKHSKLTYYILVYNYVHISEFKLNGKPIAL